MIDSVPIPAGEKATGCASNRLQPGDSLEPIDALKRPPAAGPHVPLHGQAAWGKTRSVQCLKGAYSNTGRREFQALAQGDHDDWVLVVDDATRSYLTE